ncbi:MULTISPECIES: winged helix DNA-binding protein [Brucella/Ochrobactrum group]|uniref:Transcriptional regulator n=1 Tax=Brucella anthropi (strain ATCC 49188 / DSM 6882 / CCUG 24695 / JCM 21032 / LMG 3331 / NBRC 15819 / NCTC 12168 / Alc 37) TaxID=439375 RepID=A6X5K8_BRUA4|nr:MULTISPECIES: winged helix DNA-binding protein [Brucella/Ochrobactrum group]ABS16512.1 putative transcriptional regulator [Brucella anthropi ATCC 49188]AIK42585.1 winged helix DNA-binding domain protein [Brucella anthropi]MCQ9143470.1 winged helix DNA-binding protein [Ochrobactrum sp. BTU2]QQC27390.1 winged helix DNA-binding protein [Brucella anthropi]UGQ23995.1 winged helix DNA-binding protein [Brucella anthropi]
MGKNRGSEETVAVSSETREASFDEVALPKHLRPVASIGPIVSSAHLAEGGSPGMSEVEYGLILASHAFSRWMVRCMAAAGLPGLSPIEVLILHSIRHRDREKKLADICLVLDIEDTHIATYAIRKLENAGLLTTGKAAKEKTVKITAKGAEACARYAQIRERLLVDSTANARPSEEALSEVAALLRFMSGAFNQATRSAITL